MRDDGHCRKRIHVGAVTEVVIVVKMCVEQKAHRLVRPLADLSNVFPGSRGKEATVDHEDLPFSDDHRGIAAHEADAGIPVLNFVDAFGQPGYLSLSLPMRRLS